MVSRVSSRRRIPVVYKSTIASRIISVCDAYGAMTCDRPYRAAMDPADALHEVQAGAGTQFDPSVVDALVEALVTAGEIG